MERNYVTVANLYKAQVLQTDPRDAALRPPVVLYTNVGVV